MKLTFGRCNEIADTLPIGYYAGRRVDVELSKTESTSFYDPMEDKIVVSYPIIAHRLEAVSEGACNDEEAVRSMLYHEVSHAILTPGEEMNNSFQVNVMEDERIETVLRNYYHGVNFRKQLYDIHGGHAPNAKDAKGAYFNAVRFGLGTPKVKQMVKEIVKTYAHLNRGSRRWDRTGHGIYNYEDDIEELWNLINKEYKTHPEQFQPASNSNKGNEGDESEDNGNMRATESENEADKAEEMPMFSSEQMKRMVGEALSSKLNLDEAQVQKLDNFQKTAEMIIENFHKKNKGGNGINTYSGVFNPRAVARKDYRYFERSMATQGNNKFGSCHLNLIIDCSGSFYDNVPLTNGVLAVLSEIERKNRNFSIDVAFINHEFRICKTVRERKMVADGGNDIPDDMKAILNKLQRPQTCNYNIILFDGDALCNRHGHYDPYKLFGAFDMRQTTLITDPDNERYMKPKFSAAKVVVTQNYTQELIGHIINALTIAFG